MTLWERVEALAERVGRVEKSSRALEAHRDLEGRVTALERDEELQWRCLRAENESELLGRIRRLEEQFEASLPKPIPVVEPVTFSGDPERDELERIVLRRLLERLAASTWQTSDLALPRDVKAFLARARVATEKP
jgi:hypothetical protein